MNKQAKLYIWAIVLLSSVPVALYAPHLKLEPSYFILVLAFAVLAFVAEIFEIAIAKSSHRVSTSTTLYCAVLFIGGPPAIIWTTLLGTLPAEMVLRSNWLPKRPFDFLARVGFNTSQLLLCGWLAIEVFKLLGGHPPPYQTLNAFLPLIFAFVVYEIANTALVSGIITLTQRTNFTYFLKFKLRNLLWHFLALGVLSILIAVVYSVAPWNTLLVLIPLVLVHIALRGYMKLRQESQRTIEKMVQMLHERDRYTGEHSQAVADLVIKIAQELQLPEDQIETIRLAALVHDIGKVSIPDKILNKPGSLDPPERALVEQHTIVGYELLKNLEMYREVAPLVKYEHERWDGTGYPERLSAEQIPLGARIIHVADVYHALISDRPYRRAQGRPDHYEPAEAVRMIQEMSGRHFDPQVVDALVRVIAAEIQEPIWSSFGRFS
ncbi:HD-GYP domain-containing protein [Candidatus Acetothermia bacterium]|jgi:putative nucleotidyltransferase with HDIG domain|nr:HD-GYP domain-containing protein [Candidatus Acetothermia bacterium]MCI2430975.1 HD-GYP domain-containing protein [Candidatus Acetothermia bacterium]MCI2437223.1 HD-GYP domain-containing protein [Candidatus Acetothermia bacterium]